MRRRTTAIISTSALAVAGATTGLIVWLSQPSYDDTVKDCIAALKERPEGVKAKPGACKGVKDDDYTALLMSQVLDDNGWTDENGDPDMGKIVEDSTSQP